jgi:glycosyltransferase involved in cell wall biosynthesis
MDMNKTCRVIFPVYQTNLSDMEQQTFSRNLETLKNHPVVLVCPEGLDVSLLQTNHPALKIEFFPAEFFAGVEGYNRLMLYPPFYERFLDVDYILICQLDVFVFRDELQEWCNRPYDYIGAPWIATPRNSLIPKLNRFFGRLFGKKYPRDPIFYKVGNGGFSLRRTKRFYEISSRNQAVITSYLEATKQEIYATEDVFWSLKAPELDPDFRIPDYREAVAFAMDRKPDIAMKINGGMLPFACHGFNKPKVRKFWKPVLEQVLYEKAIITKHEQESKTLISIALSTYNGEKYLRQQLDSLLQQTYPYLEIIVVDDVSSDQTVEILRDYEQRDNRIKIFVNEHNLGFNKSFERAFGLCSGDYICVSDQDDVWLPEKVTMLHYYIGDQLLIYSNSFRMDASGKFLGRNNFRKMLPARNDPRAFAIRNTVSGHTTLFKKNLLELALPVPPHCYYDWWMAIIAANAGKIVNRNICLTKHRIHSANVSLETSSSREKEYISMQRWISSILSIKNLRYRDFFETFFRILGLKGISRDIALFWFQLKYNRSIYNKKTFFSRMNNARKIVLSFMPER